MTALVVIALMSLLIFFTVAAFQAHWEKQKERERKVMKWHD